MSAERRQEGARQQRVYAERRKESTRRQRERQDEEQRDIDTFPSVRPPKPTI